MKETETCVTDSELLEFKYGYTTLEDTQRIVDAALLRERQSGRKEMRLVVLKECRYLCEAFRDKPFNDLLIVLDKRIERAEEK